MFQLTPDRGTTTLSFSNISIGQVVRIRIIQNSLGNRNISLPTVISTFGGKIDNPLQLSQISNSVDELWLHAWGTTQSNLTAIMLKDVKR